MKTKHRRPKTVTLSEVAKSAGVSVGAVSVFFSGRSYGNGQKHGIGLSEETRHRIVEASRSLQYQPLDPASRVRLYPETGDYCFLLDDGVPDGIANQYFSRMLEGAMQRINDPAQPIIFAQYNQTDYLVEPGRLPAPLRDGRASRFMIAGTPNYSLLMAIRELGFPAVHLSRYVRLPGICSVVPDFVAGVKEAIAALVAHGHRHIAVGAESYFKRGTYHVEERIRGLSEAMEIADLSFHPNDIIFRPEKSSGNQENEIFATLMKRDPRPTALFCFDDWTAMGVMDAAQKAGLRLPEDLSTVGCNNDPRSGLMHPALTTIHLPAAEMAAMAVDLLNDMVRQPPKTDKVVMPVKFMQRESIARIG